MLNVELLGVKLVMLNFFCFKRGPFLLLLGALTQYCVLSKACLWVRLLNDGVVKLEVKMCEVYSGLIN